MIKPAEAHVPNHTMKAENQCILCPKARSPNKKMPRKADSMKKAKAPSIARVCAMISPAYLEKRRPWRDRKSTRLNSSHTVISYAVFCLKKKKEIIISNQHLHELVREEET